MKLSSRGRRTGRVLAAVGVLVSSVGLLTSVSNALPAGTPPAGDVALTPSSGDSGTTFGMTFATPQFCPGDALAGYLWGTFVTSAANDPATLTFTTAGSPRAATGFTAALRDDAGALIRSQNPGLTDGLIAPPLQVTFKDTSFSTMPAGEYWIGIACTKTDASDVVQNEKYWATSITVTAAAGAGPNNFTFGPSTASTTTTTVAGGTTTTTVAGGTTTTTVAGGTTTTTVAGGATTTTVAGGGSATVSPTSPTPGGSYRVTYPNCRVGETITFSQPQSTPATTTAACVAPAALSSSSQPTGFRRPQQGAATGTATGIFTAAPRTAGTYTVTMTGTASPQRTVTFTVTTTGTGTGTGSGSGSTSSGGGTIPATGSSAAPVIVWGILLLVFGRIAILLGRKPTVRQAG